jgi:hypothetical protein
LQRWCEIVRQMRIAEVRVETIFVGVGVLGGMFAASFAARVHVLALKRRAPKIRRVAADPDGISIELEAGAQPAQIRWVLVRSGTGLRAVRVKHAQARNWEGVQIFNDLEASWLPLRGFTISGRHGLPEGWIRIRLARAPRKVRLILLGRLGRYGELGSFALQSKVCLPARAPSSELTRPRGRLPGSEGLTQIHASLPSLVKSAIGTGSNSHQVEQRSGA